MDENKNRTIADTFNAKLKTPWVWLIILLTLGLTALFYISQKPGGKVKLIGDEIAEKYADFDFNGAAAIAFIMMVLLLVVMALLQHRATKRSVA